MATKLKIIEDVADIVRAPTPPEFTPAPTRKRHAGWTVEKQRKFIEHLALNGMIGEACAIVGVASSSAYRLRNKAGADSFAHAWDAAVRMSATRLSAMALDRAVNGRVERFYKDGELVMERRIPSDYLLTWLLSRLDPLQFGSPTAKALAAATGDPREKARNDMPRLLDGLTDVSPEQCAFEPIDFLDEHLGETGSGEPIGDDDRA
ncbi:MAG: hypothetical protein ACJ8FT_01050 [Sphingomonas sp.]